MLVGAKAISEPYNDCLSHMVLHPVISHLLLLDGYLAVIAEGVPCLLYTSPSPRDLSTSRMPSSA